MQIHDTLEIYSPAVNAAVRFIIGVKIQGVSAPPGRNTQQIAARTGRIWRVAFQPNWQAKLTDKSPVAFEVENLIRQSAAPTFTFIYKENVIARHNHLLPAE